MKTEKNVPIPNKKGAQRADRRFETMAVGDSVLVQDLAITSVSPSLSRTGKKYGMRFTARTMADGVRVWRVE